MVDVKYQIIVNFSVNITVAATAIPIEVQPPRNFNTVSDCSLYQLLRKKVDIVPMIVKLSYTKSEIKSEVNKSNKKLVSFTTLNKDVLFCSAVNDYGLGTHLFLSVEACELNKRKCCN